jgi:small subunit ribosomal protein S16
LLDKCFVRLKRFLNISFIQKESIVPVKIRLTRVGRNNVDSYRIVVADSRFARDGRCLEILGSYNPQTSPKTFAYKAARVSHWIKQGAIPTATVANMLKQDRFGEKVEAIGKGLDPATLNLERKPERKRKPKAAKKKKAS